MAGVEERHERARAYALSGTLSVYQKDRQRKRIRETGYTPISSIRNERIPPDLEESDCEASDSDKEEDDPHLNRVTWDQFLRFVDPPQKKKRKRKHTETTEQSKTRKKYDEDRWSKRYSELKAYREAKGDCLVPQSYETNPRLGRWVVRQRMTYKNNKLSKDREQKLQQLGFVWAMKNHPRESVSPNGQNSTPSKDVSNDTAPPTTKKRQSWSKRYDELKAYREAKGDCLVPQPYNKANQSLFIWVKNQRHRYKKNILSKDREQKLQQLGFVWAVKHQQRESVSPKGQSNTPFNDVSNDTPPTEASHIARERPDDSIMPASMDTPPETDATKKRKGLPKSTPTDIIEAGLTKSTEQEASSKKRKMDGSEGAPEAASGQKISGDFYYLWNQRYEELKAYKAVKGHCQVPFNYKANRSLGRWVNNQQILHKNKQLPKDQAATLEGLGFVWDTEYGQNGKKKNSDGEETPTETVISEDYEKRWNEKYEELKAYKAEKGHCRVPKKYQANPRLAHWVARQRKMHKENLLRKDRELLLEKLDFVWDVACGKEGVQMPLPPGAPAQLYQYEGLWNQRYEELKEYVASNGDCLVPTDYKENPSLGNWVTRQREKNTKNQLRKDRKLKLEQLGFVWVAKAGRKCTSVDNSNERLGSLATDELDKTTSRQKTTSMPPGSNPELWNQRYNELKAYQADKGDCMVPTYNKENPSLGRWVRHQRALCKKNNLSKDRHMKLQQLGFVWVARRGSRGGSRQGSLDDRWNKKYEELKAYVAARGDCCVPFQYPENPSLAHWVANQRTQHKNHKLGEDRKLKLQQLGFVWEIRDGCDDERWNRKYDELKAYKAARGNCLVPQHYAENVALGQWVNTQRNKKEKLGKDRTQKLEQIGFVWSVRSRDESWNRKYEELKAYKAARGNCLVPQQCEFNPSLGSWVSVQRLQFRNKKLSKDREAKLNQLGFVWNLKPRRRGEENGAGKAKYSPEDW